MTMKEYVPGKAFNSIIGRTEDESSPAWHKFEVTGKPDLPGGKGSPGRGQLYIDDRLVGQVDIPVTIPIRMTMGGGIVIGADPGAPVTPDYEPPFRFTGKIYRVDVDVSGELIKDAEAEMRIVMVRQ